MDKVERALHTHPGNNPTTSQPTRSHPESTMSQNAHTLHLFFEDPIRLKYAQLVYQYIAEGNTAEATRWADKLGVDLADLWDGEWFNQQVTAAPSYLQLNFDTGTSDPLPLSPLAALFGHGLQAAVLDVFYDQVGETQRMYFDKGLWVPRQYFLALYPQLQSIVEPAHDPDDGDEPGERAAADAHDPAKPMSVDRLLKEEAKKRKEAQEAAEAFVEIAKSMGKNGVKNTVEGVIGVLVLGSALKGLLHAAVFTVVTVLLFKGLWLWLGLGLVLAVVLPLFYAARTYREIKGDDDDDGDETDPSGAAAA